MTKEGCLNRPLHRRNGREQRARSKRHNVVFLGARNGRTAGLPPLPKNTAIVRGTVLVTAKGRTFTTTTAGMYDTESRAFSQLDKIVKGTDRFSNSTGRLIFLTGIIRQGDGFDPRARGELCVNE
jgi:hypothetical protein